MNSAVMEPMMTNDRAVSDSSNRCDIRATMKMPAVTIVAAWIRAEIGVGPIESGSQTQRNLSRLAHCADERRMQMALISETAPFIAGNQGHVADASEGA